MWVLSLGLSTLFGGDLGVLMLFLKGTLASNSWLSPESKGPTSVEGGFSSTTGLPPGVITPYVLSVACVAVGPREVFYFPPALQILESAGLPPSATQGTRPLAVIAPPRIQNIKKKICLFLFASSKVMTYYLIVINNCRRIFSHMYFFKKVLI